MNPNPLLTYECDACGQTFTSELGLRAHDAVCIPRNMPGQSDATNKLPVEIVANLFPYVIVCNQTIT